MIPFWNAAILIGVKLDDLKVNERSEKKPITWNLIELYKPWNTTVYARLFRWGDLYEIQWPEIFIDIFMSDVFFPIAFGEAVTSMSGRRHVFWKHYFTYEYHSTYSYLTPCSRVRLEKLMFLVNQELPGLLWGSKDYCCVYTSHPFHLIHSHLNLINIWHNISSNLSSF
jgi:hypothetical protein